MDMGRYIFHGLTEDREELVRKNRQLITLRWIYLGILGAVAVGVPFLVNAPTITVIQHAAIFSIGLLLNTILYFANEYETESIKYYHVLSLMQIMVDLGVATAGVAIQGGVNSRAIILYVLPILASGLLFMSKPLVYLTALLSSIAYSTTIVLVMIPGTADEILPAVGGPFLFYPALFFIIAKLVVYLNEHNIKATRHDTQEELLALLTHQLRHPGSVISAIVDTMENSPELEGNRKLKRYVGMIKTENLRSIHLVNNILQAADPLEPTRKEEVELVGLVKKIARNGALANRRTKDIRVQAPKQVKLLASSERLHMVLENILDNAMRYSHAGTPIEVEVEATASEAKVSVGDFGKGMNRRQLRELFDKFGRTTAPEGQPHGAGLGMYLVKKLVEADGGRVSVESLPGEGTKVTIILMRRKN